LVRRVGQEMVIVFRYRKRWVWEKVTERGYKIGQARQIRRKKRKFPCRSLQTLLGRKLHIKEKRGHRNSTRKWGGTKKSQLDNTPVCDNRKSRGWEDVFEVSETLWRGRELISSPTSHERESSSGGVKKGAENKSPLKLNDEFRRGRPKITSERIVTCRSLGREWTSEGESRRPVLTKKEGKGVSEGRTVVPKGGKGKDL